MTYGVSVNWKPTTHAERMAYNKKFKLTVAKHGLDLWEIACVLERYLDAADVYEEFRCFDDFRAAFVRFDSISKKAKRLARIHASKVSTDKPPAKKAEERMEA